MNNSLSVETIGAVKATIPFLAQNGSKLTEHFYQRLFKHNPEVKSYFNLSNQESGAQQKALGGAICAFAQNIETPENLAEAISRIGSKHVSLGIKPEHYPIVGEHLLASIDDLLNPAPPEVLKAWGEAYHFLADVLIGAEKDLYKKQLEQEGGWNDFREMTIIDKKHESQLITSFYLKPKDGGILPKFKPGQYITVRIPTESSSTTMRNYSLSGSVEWDHYRISVKREVSAHGDTPEGYASSYLHTKTSVGDIIEVGPPCGDFYLQDHSEQAPILLLSGGVGITPLLAMLHQVGSNPVTFLHGATDGDHHAMRDEVNRIASQHENITAHFRYSAPSDQDLENQYHHSTGRFTEEFLTPFITPETEVYFCCPKPVMRLIYQTLKAIEHPTEKIHYEFFGPQDELENE